MTKIIERSHKATLVYKAQRVIRPLIHKAQPQPSTPHSHTPLGTPARGRAPHHCHSYHTPQPVTLPPPLPSLQPLPSSTPAPAQLTPAQPAHCRPLPAPGGLGLAGGRRGGSHQQKSTHNTDSIRDSEKLPSTPVQLTPAQPSGAHCPPDCPRARQAGLGGATHTLEEWFEHMARQQK